MSSSLHDPRSSQTPPAPRSVVGDPANRPILLAITAILALSVALSLLLSRHWGISQDTPLLHYVVFLMAHGFAPYRDIIEMNMPGSYMTEWAVIHSLGPGDIAWRLYDVLLMTIAACAAFSIVRSTNRSAEFRATAAPASANPRASSSWPAYFVAMLVTIYHLGQGPSNVGQRDYALAVLLLVAYALLFRILSARTLSSRILREPLPSAPGRNVVATFLSATAFAACLGWAAAIKPTVVPFALILLIIAALLLRRDHRPLSPLLAGTLLGAAIPTLAVLAFLHRYHATSAFIDMLRTLAPYHRGNGNLPLSTLLLRWLPWMFYPAAILTAALLVWNRRRLHWPQLLLLYGFVFGIANYIYQAKGWTYHAAPAMLFLLVLLAALLATIHSEHPRLLAAAIAVSALLPALYVPYALLRHGTAPQNELQTALTADLSGLGPLSGKVQCLDWNAGCLDVLYRQRIVQSTGFIYDFYLFPAHPAPITAQLQQRFLDAMQTSPPRVIVLTDHDWPTMQGFAELDRWPAFTAWLNLHYKLDRERSFVLDHPTTRWLLGHSTAKPTTRAYRLYVLKQ